MKEVIVVLPFLRTSELVRWAREAYSHVPWVEIVGYDEGSDPVMTYSDIEMNLPGILKRLMKAEKEGYKAAIIGCFGDPGLHGARQILSIPVLGPGETSLAIASTLGEKILLIEPGEEFVFATEVMVRAYGYDNRVVGIYPTEFGFECCVPGSDKAEEISRQIGADICSKVEQTGAHVIVLGCIGFNKFTDIVKKAIEERGFLCPIVEPGIVTMHYAKFLLGLGLNESRQMFGLKR
jgi:allantoin racemase